MFLVHGCVYLIERYFQLEIYYSCASDDKEMRKGCFLLTTAGPLKKEPKMHDLLRRV